MKNKKIISLVIVASLTSSAFGFTGIKASAATNNAATQSIVTTLPSENSLGNKPANAEFLNFITALNETQAIKNGEAKDNSTLSIKINNVDWSKLDIPQEDQAAINLVLSALQNLPITSDTKFMNNGTSITTQSDVNVTLLGAPVNFKTWTSTDMSTGIPTQKVTCKIPDALKTILSIVPSNGNTSDTDILTQLQSKDYIYYDSSELAKYTSVKLPQTSSTQQYKTITQNFVQELIVKIIANAQAKNSSLITKNSDSEYELKLTNSSINELLEQFASDDATHNIMQNYVLNIAQLAAKDSGKRLTQNDVDKLNQNFSNFITGLKNQLPIMEKSLSSINFNLDVKYTIGSEGYISTQNGTFTLNLDEKSMPAEANNEASNNDASAFQNASIDVSYTFSNTLNDLGSSVTIDPAPTITADNSIDYSAILAKSINDNKVNTEKGKAKLEIKNHPSKFANKTSNDANKSWSIKFKRAVDPSTVNDATIMIFDDDFNAVDCKLSAENNMIIVTPKQAYSKNKNYHIYISDSVTDTNGVHLPQAIHQDFVIK